MKPIPKKYQPRGFEIVYEDLDIIIGNKAAGLLSVAAKWESANTAHNLLNQYIRKGNPRSTKNVYVVHRLDQATTGLLMFAKSESAQQFLKNNWKTTIKHYYVIVHGILEKKKDTIQSYLSEDEDYHVHSSQSADDGKLAITEYEVLKEVNKFSLIKVNLITGKKNQIRVHMSEIGHPIVGDVKYGPANSPHKDLRLHSASIEFTHPHSGKRIKVEAKPPKNFSNLIEYNY